MEILILIAVMYYMISINPVDIIQTFFLIFGFSFVIIGLVMLVYTRAYLAYKYLYIQDHMYTRAYLVYKYLYIHDDNAIETIPSTIKSNDLFEVIIQPLSSESTNLAPNGYEAYQRCQFINIYEGRLYKS